MINYSERDNQKYPDIWPVSLDIGNHGTRVVSGNCACSFPSGISANGTDVTEAEGVTPNVQYRDERGTVWEAGIASQDTVPITGMHDSTFLALVRTGIACGMRKNRYGSPMEKTVKIQVSLPSPYCRSDHTDLPKSLCGTHDFAVKFGTGPWERFMFTLRPEDINLIDQVPPNWTQGNRCGIFAD